MADRLRCQTAARPKAALFLADLQKDHRGCVEAPDPRADPAPYLREALEIATFEPGMYEVAETFRAAEA